MLSFANATSSAINDGILLESQIYRLLKRHFGLRQNQS